MQKHCVLSSLRSILNMVKSYWGKVHMQPLSCNFRRPCVYDLSIMTFSSVLSSIVSILHQIMDLLVRMQNVPKKSCFKDPYTQTNVCVSGGYKFFSENFAYVLNEWCSCFTIAKFLDKILSKWNHFFQVSFFPGFNDFNHTLFKVPLWSRRGSEIASYYFETTILKKLLWPLSMLGSRN